MCHIKFGLTGIHFDEVELCPSNAVAVNWSTASLTTQPGLLIRDYADRQTLSCGRQNLQRLQDPHKAKVGPNSRQHSSVPTEAPSKNLSIHETPSRRPLPAILQPKRLHFSDASPYYEKHVHTEHRLQRKVRFAAMAEVIPPGKGVTADMAGDPVDDSKSDSTNESFTDPPMAVADSTVESHRFGRAIFRQPGAPFTQQSLVDNGSSDSDDSAIDEGDLESQLSENKQGKGTILGGSVGWTVSGSREQGCQSDSVAAKPEQKFSNQRVLSPLSKSRKAQALRVERRSSGFGFAKMRVFEHRKPAT